MKRPAARIWDSRWQIVVIAAIALKLWLVWAQPIVAIGPAAMDDRLFLERANRLVHGEWLGPYSQYTLMKGPMYPLFIAATVLLHIPLRVAEHLLYLGGCLLVGRALRPEINRGSACLLFLLLWWNPMSYEMPVLGRVLRQNFYTPCTLLFFAGLIALSTRQDARTRVRAAWAVLLGLSSGALWMTREETVWAVPPALLLLAVAGWRAWRGFRWRSWLGSAAIAAASAAVLLGGVSAENLKHYGWFGTVEFRAPEFVAAYGALQRVQSSTIVPYVTVTREAREQLYRVSPAFSELKASLEGETGLRWADASRPFTGRPTAEREIGSGWFMWALRDAVIDSIHPTSARAALFFYRRIAIEVNHACNLHQVPAYRRHDSFLPPWRDAYTQAVLREAPGYFWFFASFSDFTARPTASFGDANSLKLFTAMTRWPLAPSPQAPELSPEPHSEPWRIGLLDAAGKWLCRVNTSVVLAGVAAFGVRLGVIVRRRKALLLDWVALAALLAATAVVLINLLVHAITFPNRSPGACAQAYPVVLLFGFAAIAACLATATVHPAGARSATGACNDRPVPSA